MFVFDVAKDTENITTAASASEVKVVTYLGNIGNCISGGKRESRKKCLWLEPKRCL